MNNAEGIYGWWTPRRVSFLLMGALILLLPRLHLATAVLTVLFSTFVLRKLDFGHGKWISVLLFSAVVCLLTYATVEFTRRAAMALPSVAAESIPKVLSYATSQGIDLPFDDLPSLKTLVTKEIPERLGELTNVAKLATKEAAVFILGLVVAATIFLNPTLDVSPGMHRVQNNLYSAGCREMTQRFQAFYQSFETVMGAQLIISTVNTVFTAVFIFAIGMKHPFVLVGVTFLCGMLPIIGNILSNCVIVAVGFTMSPGLAMSALAYLVIIHKFEYFLNSKIIGDRIRNPVWLTMLGLIVGEKIMGIPGMILAPVVLYYVKLEAGSISVREAEQPALTPTPASTDLH